MRRLALIGAAGLAACAVHGRTVVLDGTTIDRAAALHEEAPRLSWAAQPQGPAGSFDTVQAALNTRVALLVRFDLSGLPAGQRIVNAELTVPVVAVSGTDPRLFLWRVAAPWGAGVGWEFRQTRPARVAWSRAGARGPGVDRALRPAAAARVAAGEWRANVTEDVDVWYTGGAGAHGWLLTVEDPGVGVSVHTPLWTGAGLWKLKITYEPE